MELELMWQGYELDGLQESMEQLFPESNFSLDKLLAAVWEGNMLEAGEMLLEGTFGDIATMFAGMRQMIVWILVLGIVSALMTHFVEVFDRHQIADLSFYFVYLMMTAILLKGFYQVAQIAEETLENIIVFHKLLLPTYLVTVGVATGVTTVTAYTQLLLLIMYGVERILLGIVLPLIYSYCLMIIVNGIWAEEKLSLLMELLEKVIGWILKVAIGFVTGVSVFQSVVTPVIDSVKTTTVQKLISVIPGAGSLADGALELMAGSAVMIKNSLGIVLLLLLLSFCAAPILQIFAMALLFKCSAAFLGIIADKRVVGCVNRVGDAGMLLLRTVGCVVLLFVIAIGVVAATTGRMVAA